MNVLLDNQLIHVILRFNILRIYEPNTWDLLMIRSLRLNRANTENMLNNEVQTSAFCYNNKTVLNCPSCFYFHDY